MRFGEILMTYGSSTFGVFWRALRRKPRGIAAAQVICGEAVRVFVGKALTWEDARLTSPTCRHLRLRTAKTPKVEWFALLS
jgi:hypothetical protein